MLETIAEALRATIAVGLVLAGILAILIWVRNLTKKFSSLRLFTQIVATIAIFVLLLFWPIPWNLIISCLIFSIALRLPKHRTCGQTNLQIQKLVKRRGMSGI